MEKEAYNEKNKGCATCGKTGVELNNLGICYECYDDIENHRNRRERVKRGLREGGTYRCKRCGKAIEGFQQGLCADCSDIADEEDRETEKSFDEIESEGNDIDPGWWGVAQETKKIIDKMERQDANKYAKTIIAGNVDIENACVINSWMLLFLQKTYKGRVAPAGWFLITKLMYKVNPYELAKIVQDGTTTISEGTTSRWVGEMIKKYDIKEAK